MVIPIQDHFLQLTPELGNAFLALSVDLQSTQPALISQISFFHIPSLAD
jgi:hypothetical protein